MVERVRYTGIRSFRGHNYALPIYDAANVMSIAYYVHVHR